MIAVEEIEIAAHDHADRIMEKFYPSEAKDAPLRDLLAATYVAGANHVVKSMLVEDVNGKPVVYVGR